MKSRKIVLLSILVALLAFKGICPGVIQSQHGTKAGSTKSNRSKAYSPDYIRYRWDEYTGDVRTAVAIISYILEPEPTSATV